MEVTVNQQKFIVSETCSISQLLSFTLNVSAAGIAVAINENIIPKTTWGTYQLQPNDQVILIKATQGG